MAQLRQVGTPRRRSRGRPKCERGQGLRAGTWTSIGGGARFASTSGGGGAQKILTDLAIPSVFGGVMAHERDRNGGGTPDGPGVEDLDRRLRTYFNLAVEPSDRGEIDDLVQECMLRLARYEYRWPAARKIAKSVHVDFVRGKRRRKQQEEIVMQQKSAPHFVSDQHGLREEADRTTARIREAASSDDEKNLVALALEIAQSGAPLRISALGPRVGMSASWARKTWAKLLLRIESMVPHKEVNNV